MTRLGETRLLRVRGCVVLGLDCFIVTPAKEKGRPVSVSSRTRSGLKPCGDVSKIVVRLDGPIVSAPRPSGQGSSRRSAPYKLARRHACLLKQFTRARRLGQASAAVSSNCLGSTSSPGAKPRLPRPTGTEWTPAALGCRLPADGNESGGCSEARRPRSAIAGDVSKSLWGSHLRRRRPTSQQVLAEVAGCRHIHIGQSMRGYICPSARALSPISLGR